MRWRITPNDGSGERIVRCLSAHSWATDPNDDRANQHLDRVVLLDGPPLPDWAAQWLDAANRREMTGARAAFQAAVDDADNAPFRDYGDY